MSNLTIALGQMLCNVVVTTGLSAPACYSYQVLQSIGFAFLVFTAVLTLVWGMLRQAS